MTPDLTPAMKRALRKVKRRKFCAHWLLHKSTMKALLRRCLIVPCGWYSVCLPEDRPCILEVSYAKPEEAFDE